MCLEDSKIEQHTIFILEHCTKINLRKFATINKSIIKQYTDNVCMYDQMLTTLKSKIKEPLRPLSFRHIIIIDEFNCSNFQQYGKYYEFL